MELLSTIVQELVNSSSSVSSPLLKTKVLASRLENAEVLQWVTNELKGYSNDEDLPKYRIYVGSITGNVTNGNRFNMMKYTDIPIPVIGLEEETIRDIYAFNFHQSVTSLENLKGEKSGTLVKNLSAETIGAIQNNWRDMGNPFIHILDCKVSTSTNAIDQILSLIRNNLLDFILELEKEFGKITNISQSAVDNSTVTSIFNNTVINTSGDGNVINTGKRAKIKNEQQINKGVKEDLRRVLASSGIIEGDIKELLDVIDDDLINSNNAKFGDKVSTWIKKNDF